MTNNKIMTETKAARKADDVDGFLDKYVWEPVAMVFSRIFIRLGIVPNVISLLSLVIGVTGGILLGNPSRKLNLLGMVLLFFSGIFDTCDGQVARLTNNRSPLGRFLDGSCDTLVDVAAFLAMACRLSKENIPFTNAPWGWVIFPIVIYCGVFCVGRQCSMADHYRNLHLYFLGNSYGSELDRSKNVAAKLKKRKEEGAPFWELFYLWAYGTFTRAQEAQSPKMERLLDAMEKCGKELPEGLREDFLNESAKYIKLAPALTYNIRTVALFVCIALGKYFWFFLFQMTVVEAICFYMINRYEKIADRMYQKYFSEKKEK